MHRRILKKIVYYTLVTAVLAGTVYGIYFGFIYSPPDTTTNHPPPIQKDKKPEKSDAVTSVNLKKPEIKHFVGGKIAWQVKAESVETRPKTGQSVFLKSHGQVFGKNGRILSFIAPLTVYDPAINQVRVQGLFSSEVGPPGLKMHGRDLQWNDTRNQLDAHNVEMQLDGAGVRGDSVSIRPVEKTVAFQGNVLIKVPLNKKYILK
jgi:hypothetical protein